MLKNNIHLKTANDYTKEKRRKESKIKLQKMINYPQRHTNTKKTHVKVIASVQPPPPLRKNLRGRRSRTQAKKVIADVTQAVNF